MHSLCMELRTLPTLTRKDEAMAKQASPSPHLALALNPALQICLPSNFGQEGMFTDVQLYKLHRYASILTCPEGHNGVEIRCHN